MKILMLVPFLPNINTSGGQTRWYNLLKYLSKTHDITLFSLLKDESERKYVPELEKYCKKVRVFSRQKSPWSFRNLFLTIFSFYPLLVIRNWSFEEKRELEKELKSEEYDLIHAEAFYVMPHLPRTHIPTILVEQTIEYRVYKHIVNNQIPAIFRPFLMIDIFKLHFWEKYFWKKTNCLVAVSEDDKKIMEEEIPGISVEVIPNGIDVDYFQEKKVSKLTPPRILYLGNFKWLQNVEAVDILVDKVWPIVKNKISEVKLWIVGRSMPERFLNLTSDSNIEVTESITDQRDAYKGSSVMVVPIKGPGGTRLKVLEAFAAGLPVISTSIGVAGLGVTNHIHAIVTDDIEKLAEETVRLLNSPDVAKKLALNGQKFVRQNYDWKIIVDLHDPIYAKAINNNR